MASSSEGFGKRLRDCAGLRRRLVSCASATAAAATCPSTYKGLSNLRLSRPEDPGLKTFRIKDIFTPCLTNLPTPWMKRKTTSAILWGFEISRLSEVKLTREASRIPIFPHLVVKCLRRTLRRLLVHSHRHFCRPHQISSLYTR